MTLKEEINKLKKWAEQNPGFYRFMFNHNLYQLIAGELFTHISRNHRNDRSYILPQNLLSHRIPGRFVP